MPIGNDGKRRLVVRLRRVNARVDLTGGAGNLLTLDLRHFERRNRLFLFLEKSHDRVRWRRELSSFLWGSLRNGLTAEGRELFEHLPHIRIGFLERVLEFGRDIT